MLRDFSPKIESNVISLGNKLKKLQKFFFTQIEKEKRICNNPFMCCRRFSVLSLCSCSYVLCSSRSRWELELIILDVPSSMEVQKYVLVCFSFLINSYILLFFTVLFVGFNGLHLYGSFHLQYRATGRGFVVRHIKFADNYRLYSRSHFVKA